LLTACEQDQDGTEFYPDPASKLSANLYQDQDGTEFHPDPASKLSANLYQDQDGTEFHPDPARKLSENLYDIRHCCVYSGKLLMMDRGTVRNM